MPEPNPKALLAQRPCLELVERGYSGDACAKACSDVAGADHPVQGEPAACEFQRYRNRIYVERLFCLIDQSGRIATRYDKTAETVTGFLSFAAAKPAPPTMSAGPGFRYVEGA